MQSYNWGRVPVEQVTPDIERQVIHTPSVTLLRAKFRSGAMLPAHAHVHEQVSMLMKGEVRIELDGEAITMEAGDVLRIPSNVLHSVEAIEDAVLVDVFTPARTDWQ